MNEEAEAPGTQGERDGGAGGLTWALGCSAQHEPSFLLSFPGKSPAFPPCQRSDVEKGQQAVLANVPSPALTIQDSLTPGALALGTVSH